MDYDYIKTKAIILHAEPLRSSSLKLTLHTLSSGRVILQFKGYYKNKQYQDMSLSPGTEVEIVFLQQKGSEFPLVKEMDLISSPDIRGLDELASLHHFIEFLLNITTEGKKEHGSLYKLFLSFVSVMQSVRGQREKQNFSLFAHECIGLKLLGFFSNPHRCSSCSSSFKNRDDIFFSSTDTSFFCRKCSMDNNVFLVSGKAREFLIEILKKDVTPHILKEFVFSTEIVSSDIDQMSLITMSVFQSLSGDFLKSEKVLKKIQTK